MARPRRVMSTAELLDRMPRAFRPKLRPDTVQGVALAHLVNLEDVHAGRATFDTLIEMVESFHLWSLITARLGLGMPEAAAQLELGERMLHRYRDTGRVEFSPGEYDLARAGVMMLDQLAETVDARTATECAIESEATMRAVRDAVMVSAGGW